MLNRCEFIGHLGRDPECKVVQNGNKLANLSIGVTEKWKKDGEQHEHTEWIRAVLFGNIADIAERYLSKGSKIYVSGKWKTQKWTDQQGNDRYSTELVVSGFDGKLVMLDSRSGNQPRPAEEDDHNGGDDLDSDTIPF